MIRVSFEAPSKAALDALLNEYLEGAPPAPAIANAPAAEQAPAATAPAAPRGRGRPAKTNSEAPAAKDPPSQGEPVPAAAASIPQAQPSPAAPVAAAATFSKQDVIDALQAMVAATGAKPGTPEAGQAAKDYVSPLLTAHGSSNITGLDASKYGAVIADAKAKAEEIKAKAENPLA